jgi:hypothetical protein
VARIIDDGAETLRAPIRGILLRARPLSIVLFFAAASPVGAQVTTDSTITFVRRLEGTRLQPGSFTYRASLRLADSTRFLGDRVVRIAQTNYAGTGAWLLLETRGARENLLVDSLLVDIATLQPMHWGSLQGFTTLAAEFRGDSLFGGIAAPSGRRTLMLGFPPGALFTDAQTEAVLSLFPLAADWRDSIAVMVTGVGRTTAIRAEVAVLGEERITTPSGTFDCWLVTLTSDVGATTYWVSKRDRLVVRSMRLVPESGGLLIYELSRADRSTREFRRDP